MYIVPVSSICYIEWFNVLTAGTAFYIVPCVVFPGKNAEVEEILTGCVPCTCILLEEHSLILLLFVI